MILQEEQTREWCSSLCCWCFYAFLNGHTKKPEVSASWRSAPSSSNKKTSLICITVYHKIAIFSRLQSNSTKKRNIIWYICDWGKSLRFSFQNIISLLNDHTLSLNICHVLHVSSGYSTFTFSPAAAVASQCFSPISFKLTTHPAIPYVPGIWMQIPLRDLGSRSWT